MVEVSRDSLEICPASGKIITRITWDRYTGGWFAYRLDKSEMAGDGDGIRWEKVPLQEWLDAIQKLLDLKASKIDWDKIDNASA
jgi:hypothetical protein